MPSVNVSDDASVDACQYFWCTTDQPELEATTKAKAIESVEVICDHDDTTGALRIREMKGWSLKSTDRVYAPDETDVGRQICLAVVPCNKAGRFGLPRLWTTPVERPKPSEMFRKGVIIEPPAPMIWTERHRLCSEWAPKDT